MTKKLLWLDDIRDPNTGTWIEDYSPISTENIEITWAKSFAEFTNWISENGLPDAICFDHDLGRTIAWKDGYACAKWLVEYCIENDLDIPKYNIQSSNPPGTENIKSYLENYKKFRGQSI